MGMKVGWPLEAAEGSQLLGDSLGPGTDENF